LKNVRKADVDADAACVQHEELIKKRLMCLSEDRPKAVRNVSGVDGHNRESLFGGYGRV